MKLIKELKSPSSKWIYNKGVGTKIFIGKMDTEISLTPSEIDTVVTNITNQHEHHRKKTFQYKYRTFLKKYYVVFNQRYVWD